MVRAEDLDNIMRLLRDIRMAVDFRERLKMTGGVADLVVFGTGERIFTRLSPDDIAAIDNKINQMINELVNRVNKLKSEGT